MLKCLFKIRTFVQVISSKDCIHQSDYHYRQNFDTWQYFRCKVHLKRLQETVKVKIPLIIRAVQKKILVNSVKEFSYLTDMVYIGIESPENNGFKAAVKIVWQHEMLSVKIINQLLRHINPELMSQGER